MKKKSRINVDVVLNALILMQIVVICVDLHAAIVAELWLKTFVFILVEIILISVLAWELIQTTSIYQNRRLVRMVEALGEPVPSNHGETVDEFVKNIRSEEVEYIAFFTSEGKKLYESTLNHPTMAIPSDNDWELTLKHPDGIMIRNHPSKEVTAFLDRDLIYLSSALCKKLVVVTPYWDFVMEAPKKRLISNSDIMKMSRRYWYGKTVTEASLNFCTAVAMKYGWNFYMVVSRDMVEEVGLSDRSARME